VKLVEFYGDGWGGRPVQAVNVFGHRIALFELWFRDNNPTAEYEVFCQCEFGQAGGRLSFKGYETCRLKRFGAIIVCPILTARTLARFAAQYFRHPRYRAW
jgi:hypothetical protein